MKKSRFAETQIVAMLREHEAGKTVADLCREPGVRQPTFYQWKAKYSSPEPWSTATLFVTGSFKFT